jgi:catechol 2,3-dioxygenase-like lactoylglutathione lyase family enzyme
MDRRREHLSVTDRADDSISSPFAGIDHVGYVVSDLDAASAFFVDVLGFEALPRRGEASDDEGDVMTRWFGVHARASYRFAFFALSDSTVELLEWTAPDQHRIHPLNSDHGGRHLAIKTRDLDAALARLQEVPGVSIRARAERGFVYVSTPFGLEVQLIP